VAHGKSGPPPALAERMSPVPGTRRPPRNAQPEDSTEVMTSGRLPVVPRQPVPGLNPDSDATAPIMKLRDVQRQRDLYLRKRAAAGPAWLKPLAQVSEQSAERLRFWTSSGQAALKRRWEQSEQRKGLLIFGGLLLIGTLLALLILFSS
jgi:hypothetical protein